MSTPPVCGAQQPGSVSSPFDWGLFTAVGTAGGATAAAWAWASAHFALGAAGLTPAVATATFTSAVAGAAAIFVMVLYFALEPDGCIRATTNGQPVCLSGIVEDTTDESNTAIAVLAPFAMGPAGMFDLVVKSMYWQYVTQNSYWVFCSPATPPAAMLPCFIKSKTACGGRIGSLVGVTAGAIGGVILGYLAGVAVAAAIGCSATLIFYILCVLVCLIVAAVVAAAVAYAGSLAGGWVGEAIASAGSDPVGDTWKGLQPGAIVTVKGNWITDPNLGNNELYYTTAINRTGQFKSPPSYTTADADSTAADDCPIIPTPTSPPVPPLQ